MLVLHKRGRVGLNILPAWYSFWCKRIC